MTRPLRVGVVGGKIGAQHIEAWQALPELFEVAAFCDIAPAVAEEVRARYAIATAVHSLDELMARDDLDIIDLCTPSSLHYAQTAAALRAGKHVVCEKPLAGSLAEVDELIALERQTGRRVCPIFQYRFGNGFRQFLDLKERGLLGKSYLATIETHWKRGAAYYANPWRGRWQTELGGTLITHAIHAHDMLVVALGPIRSVYARIATRVNAVETEDCAVLALETADGTLVALSVTVGAAVEISRLRFCFEKATVESDYAPYRPHIRPWTFQPMDEAAGHAIERALAEFTPGPEHFHAQFTAFHKALAGLGPMPVSTADARTAIELLTAAYHSARTGAAVTLPIGADHPAYGGWLPEIPHG